MISDFFSLVDEIDLAQVCFWPHNMGMGELADLLISGEETFMQPFYDVVICLFGHHLVSLPDWEFITQYRRLVNAISNVNPLCHVIVSGLLPHPTSPDFYYRQVEHKNWVIKKYTRSTYQVYYCDLFAKMAVAGSLPINYFDEAEETLNRVGFARAVYCWGHRIAGIADLWSSS